MADSGFSLIDLANLALAGYNAYQKSQGPQFKNPGLTPEQQQLYQLYFGSLLNPATQNNVADVSNFAKAKLAAVNPTWTSPKTFSGDVGYSGHGPVNFNWQQTPGGVPNLPKIPSGPNFGGGSDASGPTGVAGDPFGHITSPAGSQYDPFSYMNNLPAGSLASGNTDASGLFASLKNGLSGGGSMAALAGLASMLGLPAGIVASWLARSKNQQPQETMQTNDLFKGKPTNYLTPDWGSAGAPLNQSNQYLLQPNKYQLGIDGHPIYQTTPSQLAGQVFLSNQMNNMRDNGVGSPEGQGIPQVGFGYGMDYNSFYGGTYGHPHAPLV